jgi:hypothetical protein
MHYFLLRRPSSFTGQQELFVVVPMLVAVVPFEFVDLVGIDACTYLELVVGAAVGMATVQDVELVNSLEGHHTGAEVVEHSTSSSPIVMVVTMVDSLVVPMGSTGIVVTYSF